MVMSLCTCGLRRIASGAAPTGASGACQGTVHGGIRYSPFLKTYFPSISPSVGWMLFSSAAAGAAAAEPHRCREVESAAAAPPPAAPTATDAHTSVGVVLSTVFRSYIGQLPRYGNRSRIPFTCHRACGCTSRSISQQILPKVSRHTRCSNGCYCTLGGSRRYSTVIIRYCTSDNTEICSRFGGSWSSTRCCVRRSSNSISSDRSTRVWDDGTNCTAGRQRGFSGGGNESAVFGFNSVLSLHAGPLTSAVRRDCSLPKCFSLSSLGRPCWSPFSCFPSSSLPPPLSCLLLSSPRQHATQQRGARTAAAALSVSASAQPRISRTGNVEGDWTQEEEQRFPSSHTSAKPEEIASLRPQKHDGGSELSSWDFAQIRRVPPANKRAAGVSDAAAKGREEARETEGLPRDTSIAGQESPTEAVVGKSPHPVVPRSRRVQDSGRRAPPLLRVTDAAAARIREIVETYNRETALSKRREVAAFRNGCRQQDNVSSNSTHSSSSNSDTSSEEHAGAGARRRAIGIRIGLKKRGCSGLSYTIDVATREEGEERQHPSSSSGGASAAARTRGDRRLSSAAAADEIVETQGGTVVLAGDAIMFLVGTELDFIDTELERKFVFRNPNEKQACGCGKSFTV